MSTIPALRYRIFGQMVSTAVRSGRRYLKGMGSEPPSHITHWYPWQPSFEGLPHIRSREWFFYQEKKEYLEAKGIFGTKKGSGKRAKRKK